MGYHTFNIFHKLTLEEGDTLLNDAYDCMKRTGAIRVRPLKKNDDDYTDEFTDKLSSRSRYFLIEYTKAYKGLSWLLRLTPKSPGFITTENEDRPCSIKARINPKPFTGIQEYLAAANADYLDEVEKRFNTETAKISPVMGRFEDYEFNRIDYCINFSFRELGINCDPLCIMELFKRSNIPKHFYRPYTKNKGAPFDGKTAGTASLPADDPDLNRFILFSNSVNINCYYKYAQLRKDFLGCPDIKDSTDIIRFEVQCLYPKAYYMSKAIRNRDGFTNLFSEMLSDETSTGIIVKYFEKIIRRGDYYSLPEAVKKIQAHNLSSKVESRLINTLVHISKCGGIHNAKLTLVKPELLEDFRRSLRELAVLKINPVTIPEGFGISHIPNPLDAYYVKFQEEEKVAIREEWQLNNLKDCIKEFGYDF